MQDIWGEQILSEHLIEDHLVDPGVDGRIIIKYILEMWDWEAWIGSIQLMIGTRGGLMYML